MKPLRCLLVLAVGIALYVPQTAVGQVVVEFTPFDLADNEIGPVNGLPDMYDADVVLVKLLSGTEAAVNDPCVLSFQGGYVTPSSGGRSDCLPLWHNPDLSSFRIMSEMGELELRVAQTVGAPDRIEFDAEGQRLLAPALEGQPIAIPSIVQTRPGWHATEVYDGVATLTYEDSDAIESERVQAVFSISRDDGRILQWLIRPATPAAANYTDPDPGEPVEPVATTVAMAGGATPVNNRNNEVQCPAADAVDDYYIFCVDGTRDRIDFGLFPSRQHVIHPNHSLNVMVYHWDYQQAIIEVSGKPGLHATDIRTRGSDDPLTGHAEPQLVVTEKSFAPRPPGNFYVTVSLQDEFGLIATDTLEIVVEETYSGVFRIGVAGILFGAVDGDYKVRKRAGSDQPEVAVGSDNAFDVELIVAFAPYLESGGRGLMGCDSRPWCFSPYLAVGAVSQTDGELEFLKSFHVGVEWEPVSNFSIAVTGVARRVTRLEDGVLLGMPAEEDEVPTTSRFGLGMGIIVNFSPSFLQVVSSSPVTAGYAF